MKNSPPLLGKRFSFTKKPIFRLSSRQLEVKNLFMKKIGTRYHFVEAACECGSHHNLTLSYRDRYGLPIKTVICSDCGLIYQSPRLDSESIISFYTDIYRDLYLEHSELSDLHNYFLSRFYRGVGTRNWVTEQLGYLPKKVLEIGCADGGLLKAFQVAGSTVIGLDFNEKYLKYGRSKGLDLRNGSITLSDTFGMEFDLCILSHSLEHFSCITKEICNIKNVLKPSGYLFVSVPNISNLRTDLYDFLRSLQIAHNYYFTPKTLKQTLSLAGYQQKAVTYGGSIFSLFKYTNEKEKKLTNYCYQNVYYLKRLEKMRPFKNMVNPSFWRYVHNTYTPLAKLTHK